LEATAAFDRVPDRADDGNAFVPRMTVCYVLHFTVLHSRLGTNTESVSTYPDIDQIGNARTPKAAIEIIEQCMRSSKDSVSWIGTRSKGWLNSY
jgi:hypothetical protein